MKIPSRPVLEAPSGALTIASEPEITDTDTQLSLVVPTYNEQSNITTLVDSLIQVLDPSLKDRYELILVDDDSPDRTWEVAQGLTARYPQLRVMRRKNEHDLATAVIRGWQAARGKILGVMDADLQHPPDVLLRLWKEINQGVDLAIASRHVRGGGVSDWHLSRRILSRGAQILGMVLLPSVVGRVSDPMSGYFMVQRRAIANIALNPTGFKILLELLGRGRIRSIAEVGYVFRERKASSSKADWGIYMKYVVHLMRLRLATLSFERKFNTDR